MSQEQDHYSVLGLKAKASAVEVPRDFSFVSWGKWPEPDMTATLSFVTGQTSLPQLVQAVPRALWMILWKTLHWSDSKGTCCMHWHACCKKGLCQRGECVKAVLLKTQLWNCFEFAGSLWESEANKVVVIGPGTLGSMKSCTLSNQPTIGASPNAMKLGLAWMVWQGGNRNCLTCRYHPDKLAHLDETTKREWGTLMATPQCNVGVEAVFRCIQYCVIYSSQCKDPSSKGFENLAMIRSSFPFEAGSPDGKAQRGISGAKEDPPYLLCWIWPFWTCVELCNEVV